MGKAERDEQGHWKKGRSGNPTGENQYKRNVRTAQENVRQYARQFTKPAIDKLNAALEEAPKWEDKIHAAIAILEHGWGRPPQAVFTSGTSDESMSWEKLLDMVQGSGTNVP